MLLHTVSENNSAQAAPLSPELTAENSAEQAENGTAELVDFYLTDPAYSALSTIRAWAQVILAGMGVIVLLELAGCLMVTIAAVRMREFNALYLFNSIRYVGFAVLTGWVTFMLFEYIRNLGRALKVNDNSALAAAFRYQNLFFKWLFILMMARIGNQFLEAALNL